ncbi:MAG: DUF389 domain-containing protein [Chitinophagales bacterium]|nr:DUF389 domain-containing protein [Chitinophagales bacterium]
MYKLEVLARFFRYLFYIPKEDDNQTIEEEIIREAKFKGINLWVMIIAVFIACVGLNIDSTSMILGSMILSPLMGPTYAVSFGLAKYDFNIIRYGLKNMLIIISISLLVAILYFFFSPFYTTSQNLINYSSVTVFDIFVAFAGGFAGFIAISLREGSRYLVGVAIATSCIPPLSACGFGIVNQNWPIAFGGIYLYITNSYFILLGSFLAAKMMKFSHQEIFKRSHKLILSVIFSIIFFPSLFFSYRKFHDTILKHNVENYIQNYLHTKSFIVLNKDIDFSQDIVDIYYTGILPAEVDNTVIRKHYKVNKVKFNFHKI